jgi:predicted AAA+ superfamily ATPase
VYLLDTGTLAFLLGVSEPHQVQRGVAAGPLFESAVLGQLQRLLVHRGEPARVYFWRTTAGHEVDFVVEIGERLVPFEAKVTATPRARDGSGIEELQRLLGRRVERGYVVCFCPDRVPLTRSVEALPLGAF